MGWGGFGRGAPGVFCVTVYLGLGRSPALALGVDGLVQVPGVDPGAAAVQVKEVDDGRASGVDERALCEERVGFCGPTPDAGAVHRAGGSEEEEGERADKEYGGC